MKFGTKIRIIFLFLLIFLPSYLFSQAPDTLWTKTYGGSGTESGNSVKQTLDGGFIITGSRTTNSAGGFDVWLIKTNESGIQQWNKTFGGSNDDGGFCVEQTSDSGYIIIGFTYSYGSGNSDVWLIKTDSAGNEVWNKTFGGTNYDVALAGEQIWDGGYIVTGRTESFGAGNADIWLVKTDNSGNEVWNKTYGGSNIDVGYSVEQTLDSGYVIVGITDSYGAGQYDVWLIKTDKEGNELWNKTYGGSNSDEGFCVEQTLDSGYVISGYSLSYGNGSGDIWLIKTDNNGNEEWNNTFGGNGFEMGWSVQQTKDNGYIILGQSNSYGLGYNEVYFNKTDENGNGVWYKTFGGNADNVGRSVQQTSDSGFIATGSTYSYGAGDADVWLLRLDNKPTATISIVSPNGGEVWLNGTTENITWSSINVSNVKIELSLNNGGSWSTIIDSTLSNGIYSWFVNSPQPSTQSLIRISDLSDETIVDHSDDVFIIDIASGVEGEFSGIPDSYKLIQNYPNPFNPSTTIYYGLSEESSLKITIYDVLGNEVMIYSEENQEAGYHRLEFNATGSPSGVYFYRLEAGDFVETKKMVLLK